MLRIVLLIIAISTDSFIFMLENGACLNKLKLSTAVVHGMIVGLIGTLMINIGLNIGDFLKNTTLIGFHKFVSILVLLCISLILFLITFKKEKFIERYNMNFKYMTTIKFAFLASIDVLLMGISLSTFNFSNFYIILYTFLITFFSSVTALYIGFHNGAAFQKLIGYLGATIYFIIANYQMYTLLLC